MTTAYVGSPERGEAAPTLTQRGWGTPKRQKLGRKSAPFAKGAKNAAPGKPRAPIGGLAFPGRAEKALPKRRGRPKSRSLTRPQKTRAVRDDTAYVRSSYRATSFRARGMGRRQRRRRLLPPRGCQRRRRCGRLRRGAAGGRPASSGRLREFRRSARESLCRGR
jgi:hypothetical protein